MGHVTLVDDCDYDELSRHKWHAYPNKSGVYACRTDHSMSSTKVRMHRQILGLDASRSVVVDHINGNTLDNRRCNLRACCQTINALNRHKPSRSNTGHPGINSTPTGFRASVTVNRKMKNLGIYRTIEEAIIARAKYIKGINDHYNSKGTPLGEGQS